MQKPLTPIGRLLSDTPAFFKRAQFLGLGLAGLGSSLAGVNGIPHELCTVLISVGSTIAIVAQFAVKQSDPLTPPLHDETK
ncbi:hypothetical protein [Mucilaginibacter psychrotolerans]|uniref:Holin n=1 Tax=Mucilaginibacter psychrotolerans TaxID=1524096 RepID=A0A4Y8S665_9SPHI|nr:hypothetical protein [Mucilaginibacter psychrotolerans]TFF34509.1 hypothetical protein E2R66_22105 [Mucilaginibacter psychrotolerans]